jgi:hypothetical protein
MLATVELNGIDYYMNIPIMIIGLFTIFLLVFCEDSQDEEAETNY